MIEVKVPDIGDYTDVPVIDVCVKAGDVVKVDDALVTLESDKATMDVPSSAAGVVKEVRVKLGACRSVFERARRCARRGSGCAGSGRWRRERRGQRARHRRLQRRAGDRHLRQGR